MDEDRPLSWFEAVEVVCGGLLIAVLIGVSSGVIQFVNAASGTMFRFRVLEFSNQLNPVNGGLMVAAALVAVRAPAGSIRVGLRIALFRTNIALAVVSGFAVLTVLTIDDGIADRLLAITRTSLPAMVLFVLAAWMARNIVRE